MVNALAALVTVISATGQTRNGRRLCARLLDATVAALEEPGNAAVEALGADARAAIDLVSDICTTCRACPRGWLVEETPAQPVEPALCNAPR